MAMALPWFNMSEREQLVWAAIYADHADAPIEAVRHASQAVLRLRELDVDNKGFENPEYVAARCCTGLTLEEFRSWYPVAQKIAKRGLVNTEDVDETACQRAYEIYCRAATDFY